MALTPEQRRLRARKAAYVRWSKETPTKAHGQRAHAGLLARFLADVPADLPEAERYRRAVAARNAYMADLALASAKARAARSA